MKEEKRLALQVCLYNGAATLTQFFSLFFITGSIHLPFTLSMEWNPKIILWTRLGTQILFPCINFQNGHQVWILAKQEYHPHSPLLSYCYNLHFTCQISILNLGFFCCSCILWVSLCLLWKKAQNQWSQYSS